MPVTKKTIRVERLATLNNPTIDDPREWTEEVDGHPLAFSELIRQPYTNMVISGGEVEGHPIDTYYLMFERDGKQFMTLLRPDEVAAVNWIASGLLWSHHLAQLPEEG